MTYPSLQKRLLRPISRSLHGIIKLKMELDGEDWGIVTNITGKLTKKEKKTKIQALEAPIFECGPSHFTQGYGFFGFPQESSLNKADKMTQK